MTKADKIGLVLEGTVVVAVLAVIGFFFFINRTPNQALGFTSVSQPAYVVTSSAQLATTTLYTFPGILHTLSVTKPVAGSVITVYDSATTTTPTISPLVITIPLGVSTTPFTITVDGIFNNGFTILQTTATSTVTVTYQQN